jgi:hypothetical protein
MEYGGWNQGGARLLFERIADTHALRMRWAESAPGRLEAELLVQYGLRIAVSLIWSAEKLTITTSLFRADFYLDVDPDAETAFVAMVDGLVRGAVRVQAFSWPGAKRPYKALLQRQHGEEWRTFYTWFRWLPWSPLARETVFVNHPATHLRAVGSA